jgi:hypothetical protein
LLLDIGFYATVAALLIGPPVGAAIVWILHLHRRRTLLFRLCVAALGLIAIVSLSLFLKVQTASLACNFAFCLAAFLAYCLLAPACWTMRPRVIGFITGTLACAALIPGYILGTIGVLGLDFMLADYLSPPIHVELVAPGLSCRVMAWGAAFADSGYTVHLYRYWPVFPLLRREVASTSVNETDPGNGPTSASCASAAAQLPW